MNLPDWAQSLGYQVDPYTSPFFFAQDSGDGSLTLGGGDGTGYYSGIGSKADLPDWLGAGNKLYEANQGLDTYRWSVDANGNMGPVDYINRDDSRFMKAALAAAALTGANVMGAQGAAASEGLSGMDLAGDAALGSGNNVYTAAQGFGGGTGALSASGVAPTSGPLPTGQFAPVEMPAMVDPTKMAQIPGGGLLGAAKDAAGWLKQNPMMGRMLFSGATSLLSGLGGGSSGGGVAEPVGPAQKWSSPIQQGILNAPKQVQPMGLLSSGQANDGAWRWMK